MAQPFITMHLYVCKLNWLSYVFTGNRIEVKTNLQGTTTLGKDLGKW